MHKPRLEGINRLFAEYRQQLEIGDGLQVANFYRFPLHFYRGNGEKAVLGREVFVQQLVRMLRVYRRLQVTRIAATVTDIIELNSSSSLVTLNWKLLAKRAGRCVELYDTINRYLVTDTAAGLKIDSLIIVDEEAKIRSAVRNWRRSLR